MNLSDLIEGVSRIFQDSFPGKIRLSLDLAQNLPAISGDRQRIRQILLDLLKSVSERINDENPFAEIKTGVIDESVSVKNDIPMSRDLAPGRYPYLEVLFCQKFLNTDSTPLLESHSFRDSMKSLLEGQFLNSFVNDCRGAMQFHSEDGKNILLRMIFSDCNYSDSEEFSCFDDPDENYEYVEPRLKNLGPGTVLLIDDEEVLLSMCGMMLEALGLKSLKASSGEEAIEIFKRHSSEIDCVFLDLSMPQMGGLEVFSELIKIDPLARIIMASGLNESEIERLFEGKSLGGVLQKPYGIDNMRAVLARILKSI